MLTLCQLIIIPHLQVLRQLYSSYIQVIDNVTHCSSLNYSLHHYNEGTFIMYPTTVYVGTLKAYFEDCARVDDLYLYTSLPTGLYSFRGTPSL